jgi:hypothetical protein
MIWLTWRQFRVQAVVAVILSASATVILDITGSHLRDLYNASGIATCKAHGDCATAESAFLSHESLLRNLLGPLLLATLVLPGSLGSSATQSTATLIRRRWPTTSSRWQRFEWARSPLRDAAPVLS